MLILASSPRAKNISLPFFGNTCLYLAIPPRLKRDVRAIVTTREAGMRWTRQAMRDEHHLADSEIVWSWPPDAEAKRTTLRTLRATGARKPGPRGDHV